MGVYESVGSRLTVTRDGDDLAMTIARVEAPAGTPALEARLLPADGDRFIVRSTALGDDLPLTFMERGDDRRYGYVHMGARLHRRVAAA